MIVGTYEWFNNIINPVSPYYEVINHKLKKSNDELPLDITAHVIKIIQKINDLSENKFEYHRDL